MIHCIIIDLRIFHAFLSSILLCLVLGLTDEIRFILIQKLKNNMKNKII